MSKNKALKNEEEALFADIIGYESVKKKLVQYCDMVCNPEVYRKLNVKIPHGVLLFGANNDVKTSMAYDLVIACGGKLYTLDGGHTDDMFCDEMTKTFEEVDDREERSVILIENLTRFGTREENSYIYEILSGLMPFFTNTEKDCFIIATVSGSKMIPKYLFRENTFEYVIKINYPTREDTKNIVNYYAEQYPVASDVNMEDIYNLMFEDTYEDILQVFNTAARYVGFDRRKEITTEDFVRAYIYENDNAEFTEKPNETSAWHEAGHLVACELLEPGCVNFAYIAMGDGTNGCVSRSLGLSTNQLVITTLAGKAALELQFGMEYEGSSFDVKRARDCLFDAIYKNGAYGFLGFEATSKVRDSEYSTFECETIVRAELQRKLLMTQRILAQNFEFLKKTANALLEKQYLLSSDIEKIRNSCTIHPIEEE